jgi:transcriptional regulator with XRE-family HTH domain
MMIGVRARDVIVVARRRAGLSQQELGDRLGRPQSTIGRWETGAIDPGFDAVVDAVRACGQQLTMGLASADDSWVPLIFEQLQRTPAQRLAHVGGGDRVAVLDELASASARAIIVGETAGALHGWPLLLPPGPVDVVAHPDDRAAVASDQRLRVLEEPPGTFGYRDLARSAQPLDLDDGPVQVAALVDLLRIALTDHDPHAQTWALALDATLREMARHAAGAIAAPQRTPEQAREEADAWLASR